MKGGLSLRVIVKLSPLAVTVLWTIAMLIVWWSQYEAQYSPYFRWLGILNWELSSYNMRFHQRGPIPADDRIVQLAIDEASILSDSMDNEEIKANPGCELLKSWPYPRKAFALALEKIVGAGARVVVFDILFSTESPLGGGANGRADNAELRAAFAKYKDKVVIGANFVIGNVRLGEGDNTEMHSITMPIDSVLPRGVVADEEIVGFVNYYQDGDTFIRRMNPVGWPYATAGKTLDWPYSLDALAVKKAFPGIALPSKDKQHFINFAGPNGTYKFCPFYFLFMKKYWELHRPPLYGGRIFKDKIVIVGPGGNLMHDEHLAPFGDTVRTKMYGPEIHANAIATLLSQRILRVTDKKPSLYIIGIVGLLYGFILHMIKSPLGKLVPVFGMGAYYWFLARFMFEGYDLFIPLVPVEIMIIGSGASVITLQAIVEQIEKHRVIGIFQQYVSKNVAQELIRSGRDVQSLMAPRKRTVTILFSDVRDFTTMTENSEPGPFVQQLNEYLTAMVECVFDNNGTLDKFVGDAVMAVFGNPASHGEVEDAWCAVKTAIEMRHRLAGLNARWEKEGKPLFRIGIGLNHGDVMAGDIGSTQKAEFGVIGDAVNVASRLEGLNKEQNTDILITDSVYELMKDRVEAEHRGDIKVKGRSKPVEIYALKSLKTDVPK